MMQSPTWDQRSDVGAWSRLFGIGTGLWYVCSPCRNGGERAVSIRKPFFAQKAFIWNHGRLLLVRKSDEDPNQPGRWEVPGGRMEFGEEVDEHLIREVNEEV